MDHISRQELFELLGCPLKTAVPVNAPPVSPSREANAARSEKNACSAEAADPAEAPHADGTSVQEDPCNPDCAGVTPPAPEPPAAQGLTGTSPSNPTPSQRTINPGSPPRIRNEAAHVRYLLATAVPRLWRYTVEKNSDLPVRQQRAKLRELLAWLFHKEGYIVRPGAPAPYRLKAELISGRIDLLIEASCGKPLVALETDWTREAASIAKLAHWHRQGVSGVWVLGIAAPADVTAWRTFADQIYGGPTASWLTLVMLRRADLDR